MKGKFITFEGCEGVGKSTQIKLLSEHLERSGVRHICTREPGGEPVAERIRGLLLDKENDSISDECEALLYAASRVQTLKKVIEPALEEGITVICDRYVDSSLAYQGYARGLGREFVEKINSYALERCKPDITIFLDLEPVAAFNRKKGADEGDRMEQAGIQFHKRVYAGYKALEGIFPDRFVAVRSDRGVEEIQGEIISLLEKRGII